MTSSTPRSTSPPSTTFAPVFTTALMAKDAQLALDLADQVGVELEVVAASQRLNHKAIDLGLADQDSIAVLKALRAGRGS